MSVVGIGSFWQEDVTATLSPGQYVPFHRTRRVSAPAGTYTLAVLFSAFTTESCSLEFPLHLYATVRP